MIRSSHPVAAETGGFSPPASPEGRPRRLLLFLAVLLVACGGDPPTRPSTDKIPPASVKDLAAQPLDHHSVRLTWTAPGDDDTTGTAREYDLRYSTEPFPEGGHWPTWFSRPDSLVSPAPAGTVQTLVVRGLSPLTRYYFGLRARDEAGQWSRRSNVTSAVTVESPDSIPPAAVTDLTLTLAVPTALTLRWTAPGDDSTSGQAALYDLRWSESPLSEGSWAQATRVEELSAPKPAGQEESFRLSGFQPGQAVHVGLKIRDELGNESPLSNVLSATTTRPRHLVIQPDGTGDAPTIQAGIDAAAEGDTVLVMPGRYYESITFRGKDIVVLGADGAVIDGQGIRAPLVRFENSETRAARLENLTITGGRSESVGALAGGILCDDASPTIQGNRVIANQLTADRSGGGAGMTIRNSGAVNSHSKPLIQSNFFGQNLAGGNGGALSIGSSVEVIDNLFEANSCGYDGGAISVHLLSGSVMIRQNRFIRNHAGDHGGAIEAVADGNLNPVVVIELNLFVENEAEGLDLPSGDIGGTGGGISARDAAGYIRFNTLFRNRGSGRIPGSGGGIYLEGSDSGLAVSHNILAENEGGGLSCLQSHPTWGMNLYWSNVPNDLGLAPLVCSPDIADHAIIGDPLFCDPDNGDFRVSSQSPAVQGEEVIGAFQQTGCNGSVSRYH